MTRFFGENVFTDLMVSSRHYGNMTKQPFSNFDLPRQHIIGEGHYVPPRAREAGEIARRRALPIGTLLLEQQLQGLNIAHDILTKLESEEDRRFATKLLGMAALNTSWYTYAKDAPDVMRRRLILPKLADHQTDWRQTSTGLYTDTLKGLNIARDTATLTISRYVEGVPDPYGPTVLGRRIGNISLQLAAVHHNAAQVGGNAFDVQKHVRDTSLDILETTREFGLETGSHPSLAQLADRDSPLAVHWRREAPDGAYVAFEAAVAA